MRMRRGFPRLSPTGALILTSYLLATKIAFDSSVYAPLLLSGELASSSPSLLNGAVAASSLLNVASHLAVVLGALNDTYVLSILVGVGFDVSARILYVVWWLALSSAIAHFGSGGDTRQYAPTIFFLVFLSMIYSYHIFVHVRALRMNESYDRLADVLRQAMNNLRGIPGERFEDHIFAYTDLGTHLAPLCLSTFLLNQQGALMSGLGILLLLSVASGVTLSLVPFNNAKDKDSESLVKMGREDNTIECSCKACRTRSRSTEERSSFTFSMRCGVCRLWLFSFEELTDILLDLLDDDETRSKKER